ncbi:MAG: ATP-binding protein [Desulfobacterales bacterium]|jgi:PAS domain S-box-containing protein|nr:ATP-binding protein [Desulfobacterales bacterium]
MPETILIVDTDSQRMARLQAVLSGYRVLAAPCADGALDALSTGRPKVLLIGDFLPATELPGLVRSLKRRCRAALVLVLTDRSEVMERLRRIADGFVGSATSPLGLEAMVRGACERFDLRRRLRLQPARLERRILKSLRERIETERFLAVKQIVDKLSAFIGRISRDVEGGVRYFNEMPYFVAIHDRQARVLAANRPYRALLGGKAGEGGWRIYDGAAGEPDGCPVSRTLRAAEAQESREVLRYRSGAKVPVIVHTAPIYDNDGQVELVLEIAAGTQDIARLQEDTRHAQQRYHLIFDAVPCYVAVLDRGLRFTANNKAFVNEFGDRVGSHFTDAFPMAPERLAASPIQATLTQGVPRHGEMALAHSAGKTAHVLVWASPMATAAGKLMQVLVILLDITQIRELQSNLATLGLMIGSISHSIKGVLTGLDAGVYLLTKGVAQQDAARVTSGLEIVQRMAERIRRMISDILLFAKERELKREPTDIRAFLEEVLEIVRPQCAAKGVPLELDLGPYPGCFDVDADILRPALVNLLENAADACAAQATAREPRVALRVEGGDADVVVTVEDNGVGMTPEQLKNLFTLFFSTKGAQGTGLGLFIADAIVRRHGGRIAVESTPGLGSRFRVSLPRRAEVAAAGDHDGNAPRS